MPDASAVATCHYFDTLLSTRCARVAHTGKDLTWWNRGKLNAHDALTAEQQRDSELAAIKAQEEQMLLEAL